MQLNLFRLLGVFKYVACSDQLRHYVVTRGHHRVTSETSGQIVIFLMFNLKY
jgi:hypothetical protein